MSEVIIEIMVLLKYSSNYLCKYVFKIL